ncbi:NAD(P)-dependent oxidoreductase [Actinoplanes ianthinogenes]|uniref:NAD(P)-dependent oxidoreductase n=1 Tax=Actinoplanes ianthinogenes TaxID=122358 RepID=A0ABM7M8F7_9ACTN|nr:NAD(P)H-binding protein [Actinoplanes ianthinogenes]BCJ47935.1 NAD(P)-dependent oxidoreductase [Actinoplanes ianthinogenes]GGR05193.1 NAD(P)-dependent oxidoreductase [Actinoplanes ianthinogenes]
MIVAVTGASGRLGRLVIDELLARGTPAGSLVPISRTRIDARTRYGDFERPHTLEEAFRGVDRLLVISTIGARDAVGAHRAAFQAAARAGVERIVYTSVQNPVRDNPFPAAGIHLHSEADLTAAGVPWTILRNALYADLRTELARCYARDGRWITNLGDGGHAFVARADCAAAAAGALTGDGHEGHVYDVTGPALVTADGYLALVSGRFGARIERVDVGDDAYERHRAAFVADPANAGTFELFTGSGRAIREGHLARLGDGVRLLAGRPPRPLEDLLQVDRC